MYPDNLLSLESSDQEQRLRKTAHSLLAPVAPRLPWEDETRVSHGGLAQRFPPFLLRGPFPQLLLPRRPQPEQYFRCYFITVILLLVCLRRPPWKGSGPSPLTPGTILAMVLVGTGLLPALAARLPRAGYLSNSPTSSLRFVTCQPPGLGSSLTHMGTHLAPLSSLGRKTVDLGEVQMGTR